MRFNEKCGVVCFVCVFEGSFGFSKNAHPGLPNLVSGLLKIGFLLFCYVGVFY